MEEMPLTQMIDCLDVETGVRQIGGDRDLYRELLRQFVANYSGQGIEIQTEIKQGELKKAAHIAHSIKEIAGVLAAVPLHSAAQKLETALRNGGGQVEQPLAGFLVEFTATLIALCNEMTGV